MPQDDRPYFFNGQRDAREYELRGSKGERQSYSKAYADARQPDSYYDNKDYMRNVGRGGAAYDQARLSQDADAVTSSYSRNSSRTRKRSAKRR